MKRNLLAVFLLLLYPVVLPAAPNPELQKPSIYKEGDTVDGWWMSEKLDGIRAVWDGKRLFTRKGNPIHAPDWFLAALPPFAIDGELWSKRNDFSFIQSTVLDDVPDENWRRIAYHIFEVPGAEGDFGRRLAVLEDWLAAHPGRVVHVIPQIPCKSSDHLMRFLETIEKRGGEGVIVKDPTLPHHAGRSPHVLKVKRWADMEGRVLEILPGSGRNEGRMGSLLLETQDGIRFRLGTGFSDREREHPPEIGSLVTFRYHGVTKNGKPRFASFMRVRRD